MPAIIQNLARPGLAINGVLIALIIALAAAVGALSFPKVPEPEPLSNMELRGALISCGLTAAPLAAAGLSPQQVVTLVDAARASLGENIVALRAAHEAVQDANTARAALQTRVRQGTAGENPGASLAAASSAITQAIAARQALWDALFDASTAGLAPERIATIRQIHAHSGWKLPTEYLAAPREEAMWVSLRDALDNLRVSAQLGEEPADAAVQLVQTLDGETSVAQARVNLGNLEAVSAAWEDATLNR
jgi:hypothetical protein